MKNLLLSIIIISSILDLSSCKEKKNDTNTPIQQTSNEPLELSTILTYHDSIGDVALSTASMKSKIDSLYDEILQVALSHNDKYLESLIIDSKKGYDDFIKTNSGIYRQSFGNATGGGSFAALYEYYYLCRYFEEMKLLEESFHEED